jgi:RNA-directed DNA polymerase
VIPARGGQVYNSVGITEQRVKASLTTYLDRKLRLPVNEKKNRVTPVGDCEFLSFTFKRGKLRWSESAFEDFKHRIRQLTGWSWGWSGGFGRHVARPMQRAARPARVSMTYRFQKLGQYLRGWMGYFGISQYYRPIPELDEWLRRRVRMCYWKQWRHTRTKVSHLLALGVGLRTAILTAVSSKSYWHLSRTKATQMGMSNDWLKAQGLVSIRDLWMKAQGYA